MKSHAAILLSVLVAVTGCLSRPRKQIMVSVERYNQLPAGFVPTMFITPFVTNAWTAKQASLNEIVVAECARVGITNDRQSPFFLIWEFDEHSASVPYSFRSTESIRTGGTTSTTYTPTRQGLVPSFTTTPGTTISYPVERTSMANLTYWTIKLTAVNTALPNLNEVFTARCTLGTDGGQIPDAFTFLLRQALTPFPGPSIDERQWFTNRIR